MGPLAAVALAVSTVVSLGQNDASPLILTEGKALIIWFVDALLVLRPIEGL